MPVEKLVDSMKPDKCIRSRTGRIQAMRVEIEDVPCHGFPQSIVLTLPGLTTLWFVPELDADPVVEADG